MCVKFVLLIAACLRSCVSGDGLSGEDDWDLSWGGSVLDETLYNLPTFFFSFAYLKNLACASKRMLHAVRDRRRWQDKAICLNSAEFRDSQTLRWMTNAYMTARSVTIDVRQLAMLPMFPDNLFLQWQGRRVIGGPGALHNMAGFESALPLMGRATFDLILPENLVGMYIGLRDWSDWRAHTQAYYRIDNIFTDEVTVSFGTGDSPPQPHPGRVLAFRSKQSHRFSIRWDATVFELFVDGVGISTVQPAQQGGPELPDALAKLFVWTFVRPVANIVPAIQYRPIPSAVSRSANIMCAICSRSHTLFLPRWHVCPSCCTWVCSGHVRQNRWRLCPRCPNRLEDYVGGASNFHAGQLSEQNSNGVMDDWDLFWGGSVLDETLYNLPTFFFSFAYLKSLACASKRMLHAVRDRRRWQDKAICLNSAEFHDTQTLRWMMEAYMSARSVTIDVRQLVMLPMFPNNLFLQWQGRWVIGGPGALQNMAGFESVLPLMGCATFDLIMPETLFGMHIGVRDWSHWRARTQVYCRIDDVFTDEVRVSFGTGDSPPQPHPGRVLALRPQQSHRFSIRWNPTVFELFVDGVGISKVRPAQQGGPELPGSLAKLFVWTFVRPVANIVPAIQYRPIPSAVSRIASITCAICSRAHTLLLPRWHMCPFCCTCVCSEHVRDTRWRLCPSCPNRLEDYVGGASNFEVPYITAHDFWSRLEEQHEQSDKFTCVVSKILRQNANLVDKMPLVLQLLPDPQQRSEMSKRVWERTLFRARAMMGLLDQRQDLLLFRFLHAEGEHLSRNSANPLDGLPHPKDFESFEDVWRCMALESGVQLHLQLVSQQQQRSHEASLRKHWTEDQGGAQNVQSMSHAQWFRLSCHRAEALRRRQEGMRHESASAVADNDLLWQRSFSPFCCPTYGPSTSLIRLPAFSFRDIELPTLDVIPDDWMNLRCPEVQRKLLSNAHQHTRDSRVSFLASSHTYYVDGEKIPLSVTGLVHLFVEDFDADKAIAMMKQSRRWPRPEYSARVEERLEPLSDELIKEMWKHNGVEAANRGTWMHLQFEVLLNAGSVAGTWPEMHLFSRFLREFSLPLIAFRTEWCVFSEKERLAGCIDFVAKSSDNSLILFDWKRTKQLHSKYTNPWQSMRAPLSHIPDCAGWHYRVQLNLYKHILQEHYDVRVSQMFVVCFHPDNTNPFIDQVPDMSAEVVAMLQARRSATNWQDASGGSSQVGDALSNSSFERQIDEDIAMQEEALRQLDQEMPDVSGGEPGDALLVQRESQVGDEAEEQSLAIQAAVPPAALDNAKKRRLLPGASSTSADFDHLFTVATEACDASLANRPELPHDLNSGSIQLQAKRHLDFVRRRHPTWEEDLVRLAASAINVYRTRLSDIFVRDFVGLVWIMEGERYIRAHQGVCYLYHMDGAFEAYTGIPPESTFFRLRKFLLKLEGLFRHLSAATRRTDESVLQEVHTVLSQFNNIAEMLHACEDEALTADYTRPRRGRGGQEGDAPSGRSWPDKAAEMLSKIIAPLQKDLLEERFWR